MDIKDLREGNLLEFRILEESGEGNDLKYEWSDWKETKLSLVEDLQEILNPHWFEFRPIPITKEILLRFGFEDSIDEMVFNNGSICFYWRKFENHFEINGEKYFITELHRMQNLIYEMFRIELKFIN